MYDKVKERATHHDEHARHAKTAERQRLTNIVSDNAMQIACFAVGIFALVAVVIAGGLNDNVALVTATGGLYVGVALGSLLK